MSVSVSMPQLGESVTEGTVTRWLKKEGERVEVDEPLLEVSTDKVDTEIPSPASGILRGIAVDEDETVAVGAQLAVIDGHRDIVDGLEAFEVHAQAIDSECHLRHRPTPPPARRSRAALRLMACLCARRCDRRDHGRGRRAPAANRVRPGRRSGR